MRLIVITPDRLSPHSGGVDRVLCSLLPEFSDLGYDVLVLYSCDRICNVFNAVRQQMFPDSNIYSISNVSYLNGLIRESQEETVVWVNSFYEEHLACSRAACRDTKAKIVYTFHIDPVGVHKRWRDDLKWAYLVFLNKKSIRGFLSLIKFSIVLPLVRLSAIKQNREFLKRVCNLADLVTVLSTSHEITLRQIVGDVHKIVKVPNPIESTSYRYDNKKKIILLIARLTSQKRIDRFFSVWKTLHRKFDDWKVIIVGDGPDRETYVGMVQRLNLPRVVFVGKKNAHEYLRQASILCLPSTHEGQGCVIGEALSCCCIPVCFEEVSKNFDELHSKGCIKYVSNYSLRHLERVLLSTMLQVNESICNGRELFNSLEVKDVLNDYSPCNISKIYSTFFNSIF